MKRLKIAVQKSGRLAKESLDLLAQCGVSFHIQEQSLIAFSTNHPIDLLRVRDDDIPGLIFDGVVDLGIVGENVLEENALRAQLLAPAPSSPASATPASSGPATSSATPALATFATPASFTAQSSSPLASASFASSSPTPPYEILTSLPFGYCRLCLALPQGVAYSGLEGLAGLRIATSYPQLLGRFMRERGVDFRPCKLTGSVEVAPRANLADAICDLVSSGATLQANGLREVATVYESRACLVRSREGARTGQGGRIEELISTLLLRIEGITQAKESKYIMLHAPKSRLAEISRLLPGAERPTILPLANDDTHVALHMVSQESLFWETMEALKAVGASSILVLPIEKMMR